jgi:putative transposase
LAVQLHVAEIVEADESYARLMVFKLVIAASKTWRRLKGTNHLPKIVAGVRFKDGIDVLEAPANHAA